MDQVNLEGDLTTLRAHHPGNIWRYPLDRSYVTTVEIYIEHYIKEDEQLLRSTFRNRFRNREEAGAASNDSIDFYIEET